MFPHNAGRQYQSILLVPFVVPNGFIGMSFPARSQRFAGHRAFLSFRAERATSPMVAPKRRIARSLLVCASWDDAFNNRLRKMKLGHSNITITRLIFLRRPRRAYGSATAERDDRRSAKL